MILSKKGITITNPSWTKLLHRPPPSPVHSQSRWWGQWWLIWFDLMVFQVLSTDPLWWQDARETAVRAGKGQGRTASTWWVDEFLRWSCIMGNMERTNQCQWLLWRWCTTRDDYSKCEKNLAVYKNCCSLYYHHGIRSGATKNKLTTWVCTPINRGCRMCGDKVTPRT